MGLTGALYTGGVGAVGQPDVAERDRNNIANTNTTAFKASRTQFKPQFLRHASRGDGADVRTSAESNPSQQGLGNATGVDREELQSRRDPDDGPGDRHGDRRQRVPSS